MDLDQRLAISYYKPIAAINEPHHVYLVQHQETKKIAIKKVLDVYNLAVYAELYRNPVAGTPRIINYYEEAGQLTVIEEYISGTSLQDKISHADIAPNDMLQYMLDLCAILEQLHLHNPAIIHRDVKPSNVIITSYNRAVLLDFNAAKYHTAAKDSDTILLGTQGYAAPEQYGFGQSSPQTDIYSMGILLKEMAEASHCQNPYIDAVTIKCPECGGEMKRVPEVIDCWFDSGSMPFAQWHYPFENKEIFAERYPADFISEAVDQTRGWFYSLLAISTLLFDNASYKNVIVLGHVQDKDGKKMSKSKGNAVDPMDALRKHGADAIRWYFYENSAPWLPNRFHDDAVQEGQRKFMGTLWNTYAFYVLYANIDNFDATKYELEYDKLSVMDKWLLSRLNTLIKAVDNNLANYKVTETAKVLQDFVDELSNWYVRRSRERFWGKDMNQDKINAYMTLYTALTTVVKLAAPMVPFITESIYRNLVCSVDDKAPISVHLCDFPVANEAFIDTELEAEMELVLEIVVLGRAARNASNIKNRQPIGNMYVKADRQLDDFFKEIVASELNLKAVSFKDDMEEYLSYSFKPQFKVLGPKVGKQIGEVKAALAGINGHAAKAELESTGKLKLTLKSGEVELLPEDVDITMSQTEGFATQRYGNVTIALETTLSQELIEEGFVREIISKLQTMRKENGFQVVDHITVYAAGNDKLVDIMSRNEDFLKKVVLADKVVYGSTEGFVKEWNINGEDITLAVK